jgi:hypothetical protein
VSKPKASEALPPLTTTTEAQAKPVGKMCKGGKAFSDRDFAPSLK